MCTCVVEEMNVDRLKIDTKKVELMIPFPPLSDMPARGPRI